MKDEKFDVIFRGQLVKGKELDEVKSNLAKLFKSSLSAVEPLFNGAETAIKKSIDYTTAMKYQTALKQSGALAIIKEVVVAQPKANFLAPEESVEETSQAVAQVKEQTPSKESIESGITANATSDATTSPQSENVDSRQNEGMTIAAAGAQIMPDKVYEKRDVDTSALSLAGVGERIIPAKPAENHPQPSIEHLSLEN